MDENEKPVDGEPTEAEIEAKAAAELETEKALEEITALLPAPDANDLHFSCRPMELTLPHCGIRIKLEVRPTGVELPANGDRAIAVFRLWIDCQTHSAPGGCSLPNEVMFNDRVNLVGESMVGSWGYRDGQYRFRADESCAVTWCEAMANAEWACLGEVAKLWVALKRRNKTKDSKGCEYLATVKLLEASGHGWSKD